jgi:hypothetical protein
MYALIVNEKVLIFDAIKHYGIYKNDVSCLSGFLEVLDYKVVSEYYYNKYTIDLTEIEQYSDFLFKICIQYLKDHCLL